MKKDLEKEEGLSSLKSVLPARERDEGYPPCDMCPIYQVLTHINIGIIIGDISNNQILILNNEALKILSLQLPPERLNQSLPFKEVLKALSISIDTINQIKKTSDMFSLNVKQRWIGYRIYRIMHTLIGIFLSDITEKKHLERLSEALLYAENLGYIFMCIRHEIGNPLNNIKTAMNILKENVTSFDRKKIAEFVDITLNEVQRIEKLLKMFKSYSLYDNIVVRKVSLKNFFSEFIRLLKATAEQEGVELVFRVPDSKGEDITVMADPEALWHILLNLFTNSLDAVKNEKDPKIEISVEQPSETLVTISVKDNGKGIPQDHLSHVFKPFFTTKPNGSGLGLPISQKLAAKMGGVLEIASREGKGTVATLILKTPLAEKQMEEKHS